MNVKKWVLLREGEGEGEVGWRWVGVRGRINRIFSVIDRFLKTMMEKVILTDCNSHPWPLGGDEHINWLL